MSRYNTCKLLLSDNCKLISLHSQTPSNLMHPCPRPSSCLLAIGGAEDSPPPSPTPPTPSPDQSPPTTIGGVLTLTPLPPPYQARYTTLLMADGATNITFLLDAHYDCADLLALGVKRPHAASIIRAIRSLDPAPPAQPPSPSNSQPTIKESVSVGTMTESQTGEEEEEEEDVIVGPTEPTEELMGYLLSITTEHVPIPPLALLAALGLPLKAGAPEVVVKMMQTFRPSSSSYSSSLHVQALGCRVVVDLLSHVTHGPSNTRALIEAGVCMAIAAAMASSPDHHESKQQQIGGLWPFLWGLVYLLQPQPFSRVLVGVQARIPLNSLPLLHSPSPPHH